MSDGIESECGLCAEPSGERDYCDDCQRRADEWAALSPAQQLAELRSMAEYGATL